jgi:mRNA interferase MazF
MTHSYVPACGDIVWMDFDPVLGSEQSGRRPALVLSHALYNERTELCIVCPITSKMKGYPFEVHIPLGLPVAGVVLVDHVKNQNWTLRNVQKITSFPRDQLGEVQDMLRRLLLD